MSWGLCWGVVNPPATAAKARSGHVAPSQVCVLFLVALSHPLSAERPERKKRSAGQGRPGRGRGGDFLDTRRGPAHPAGCVVGDTSITTDPRVYPRLGISGFNQSLLAHSMAEGRPTPGFGGTPMLAPCPRPPAHTSPAEGCAGPSPPCPASPGEGRWGGGTQHMSPTGHRVGFPSVPTLASAQHPSPRRARA